ncbi:hypothetical protein BKA83DRAFT_4497956 [Pisolithus microcarpus]|nr:hypothetical protein BKA83DRAFT_4497956 [Pisolithus microcarpus]
MPTFICYSCDESFSKKSAYITHRKKCSSKATIHLPHTSQTIVLERVEGKFMCHCTAKGCPKPYKYANSLRCHIQKAGSRWIGPGIKGDPTTMEQLNLVHDKESIPDMDAPATASGGDQEQQQGVEEAGPSRVRMDSSPRHGARPDSSRYNMDSATMQGMQAGPSQTRMDLDEENDADESSDCPAGSSTSEEVNPMVEQDENMHSPSPAGPPKNTTVITYHSSSMKPSLPLEDDVQMGSPRSEKSASPRQIQQPLPSLVSAMQFHHHLPMTTIQANQQPSLSSTTISAIPASHATGLLHHSYLDSLNLAVNAEFGFLTCQICQSALAVHEVRYHLTNSHKTQSRYSDHLFKLAILELKVASALPSNITGPRPMVHGLKVQDGMACNQCSLLSRSAERLRQHHSKHHPTMPRPSSWRSCKMQQLRRGAGEAQALWEVEDALDEDHPMSHQSLVDLLLKELEPTLQVVQTPLDNRMVSPWLLTTQWHEHMAGKDIKQLCSLVTLPKNDDDFVPGLRDAVEAYYEESITLLDRTGELVLQRLNSPDPTKR